MNDRELLEMAAKASGECQLIPYKIEWLESEGAWNPLKNDGDALRLAVKLHMTVRCYMGHTCAQIGVPGAKNAYVDEVNHENHSAATRRAIVRAAAHIGAAS